MPLGFAAGADLAPVFGAVLAGSGFFAIVILTCRDGEIGNSLTLCGNGMRVKGTLAKDFSTGRSGFVESPRPVVFAHFPDSNPTRPLGSTIYGPVMTVVDFVCELLLEVGSNVLLYTDAVVLRIVLFATLAFTWTTMVKTAVAPLASVEMLP